MSTRANTTPPAPCYGPSPSGVTDLVFLARGMDRPGVTPGTGNEELGLFSTQPTVLGTGTTAYAAVSPSPAGTWYGLSAASPVSPGPCVPPYRDLQLGWAGASVSTLTWSFGSGSLPAANQGGSWLGISSAQLGGNLVFPALNQGVIAVGQSVISQPLVGNRFAILTYLAATSGVGLIVTNAGCFPTGQGILLPAMAAGNRTTYRLDIYEGAS